MTNRITVGEVFEKCFKEYWSKDRYVKSGHSQEVRRIYEKHIRPHFETKPLSEITAKQVRTWHAQREPTPTAANRALEVLSRSFSFAVEKEWHPQNANPCKLVRAFTEKKRKRFATDSELRHLAEIINRESFKNPVAAAFVLTLMFTGSRPRALERARWDQLRISTNGKDVYGILTFDGKSSAKTGEEEQVIFPPQVMTAISHLPKNSPFIFGIKTPRRFWERIRREANCKDLWIRDWRRTFASIGVSNGVGLDMLGAVLNQHSTETTKIYARAMENPRIRTVSNIANLIDKIARPTG